VLNVGAGASDIDKEFPVNEHGNKNVVNIDIRYDPYFAIMTNPIGSIAAKIAKKIVPAHVSLIRKLAGIEGRTMVQADAKQLPFADDHFDVVLALASVHQIPVEKRGEAFKEIIRVRKRIHIAPIFEKDLRMIGKLEKELSFTIVSCELLADFFLKHLLK
jgi:hypothetical protein